MQLITSITAEPKQRFVLSLDNNETATMRLYYYPTQMSWYFDIEYGDYVNCGNKVVLTMNALRHLRNRLPFGIGFISEGKAEPFQLSDFVDGTVMMIQLNKEDVETIEDSIYGVSN